MANISTLAQTSLLFTMPEETKVKPYTTKQLANLYEISPDTMREWISRVQDLGEHGHIFNIKQVQKIFNHLGTPSI